MNSLLANLNSLKASSLCFMTPGMCLVLACVRTSVTEDTYINKQSLYFNCEKILYNNAFQIKTLHT